MYLSIIEATAFGTRLIIEQFENAGMPVESVVLSGGIPMKNPMIVQVYADIINTYPYKNLAIKEFLTLNVKEGECILYL